MNNDNFANDNLGRNDRVIDDMLADAGPFGKNGIIGRTLKAIGRYIPWSYAPFIFLNPEYFANRIRQLWRWIKSFIPFLGDSEKEKDKVKYRKLQHHLQMLHLVLLCQVYPCNLSSISSILSDQCHVEQTGGEGMKIRMTEGTQEVTKEEICLHPVIFGATTKKQLFY